MRGNTHSSLTELLRSLFRRRVRRKIRRDRSLRRARPSLQLCELAEDAGGSRWRIVAGPREELKPNVVCLQLEVPVVR